MEKKKMTVSLNFTKGESEAAKREREELSRYPEGAVMYCEAWIDGKKVISKISDNDK